jgi:hypothetical protein
MRHVLATPGLPYFHTTYLFYPFGTTIADHPHTALPALVAATLLKPVSVVTAQNVLLLAYVFLNMTCAYALAWAITKHARASVLAAVVFGLSPYIAVHLSGHFDLVAAFTLPLFALALRASLARGSKLAALMAGVVLAATAYIAYYYVVYLLFFMLVYLVAWVNPIALAASTSPLTPLQSRLRAVCVIVALACAALAAAILVTGGRSFWVLDVAVSARTPQNVLTAAWSAAIAAIVVTWRRSVRMSRATGDAWRRALAVGWRVVAVFVVGSSPLLWQAARLIVRGDYVTPEYGWRSIPHGIDLLAPLAGHPLHPLFGSASMRAYETLGQSYIEVIAWIGVVPLVLLATTRSTAENAKHARLWRIVAVAFLVWSLGPFLVVGGFDTGLKLPEILLRYVPFVANARMPGRAMVGVYMALAMILAMQASVSTGRFRSAALQWLAIGLIAFEYWAAPIRLTALDHPPVYQALASAEPGAVCEVPLGLGDGLSTGVGSQDRRVLFYATQHEHPLVAGYIGRMPSDAADRYQRTPIAGTLLALSDGAPLPASPNVDVASSPCRYIVVHRAATPTALASYLQLLAPRLIATDAERDLYRIR